MFLFLHVIISLFYSVLFHFFYTLCIPFINIKTKDPLERPLSNRKSGEIMSIYSFIFVLTFLALLIQKLSLISTFMLVNLFCFIFIIF
nr:MAG TPA: hypothetical protein [Caudoviricetes sp.]